MRFSHQYRTSGKILKKAALAITGVLVLVYIAAIFIPINPNEQQPGTRLSGNFADDQNPEWAFMEGRTRAYIETRSLYLIPHSITVSSWSQNGQLYVGCRACDTKYWPTNVVRDPNIRIKIDDKIYKRRAVRLSDEERDAIIEPDKPIPGMGLFRIDLR